MEPDEKAIAIAWLVNLFLLASALGLSIAAIWTYGRLSTHLGETSGITWGLWFLDFVFSIALTAA